VEVGVYSMMGPPADVCARVFLFAQVKEAGELDAQVLNERRARQAAEAMYRDQKATMEKMAGELKLSMEKLAERSAAELRQARDAVAAEAKQAKEALELRQAKDALAVELVQAREALQSASAGHAKEVSRLLQQVREASEVRKARIQEPAAPVPSVCAAVHLQPTSLYHDGVVCNTFRDADCVDGSLRTELCVSFLQVPQQGTPIIAETVLRRPALVEAGSTSVAADRTPSLEYVVKPPDASEVMRNSCTGEVFANENAAPQQNSEAAEAGTKAKGILKQSSGTKYVSPSNPSKRFPGRLRRSGFAVKPAVQVNSLQVRRSQESGGSSCNSVAASLSEEELQRLCGGLDMIATSNTSTFDASLQTLAHVLESTPTSGKGSRPPGQAKSVHFRSPLLLPPREELEMRDHSPPVREAEYSRQAISAGALKVARRTTLPSRPVGMKAPASGPHRVVAAAAAAKPQGVPVLREKRWN
jgi:hypothetical protein